MSMYVATPNTLPTSAMTLMSSHKGPRTVLLSRGESVVRIDKGMPRR